jgi:hypothetical protein
MKEHQKELIIIPNLTSTSDFTTSKILYNNYEIGTLQLQIGPIFSSIGIPGTPFNTQYTYTLIFDKKDDSDKNDMSLNIAIDSIQTYGFYKLNGGVLVQLSNLNLPIGTYKNIGITPEGIRYRLELITDKEESKIILSRIC